MINYNKMPQVVREMQKMKSSAKRNVAIASNCLICVQFNYKHFLNVNNLGTI